MTISSEVRKAGPYVGNDVSTSFSFAFKVFSSGDVIVVLTNPSEEESILVEGDDYTVTLNDDQDTSPGGSIEKSSALADGYLLTVTSGMENLQPVEITNLGGFYPSVLNSALDRMTILIQQVSEQVDRAVKTPISSGLTPDELLASIVESDSEAAESAAAAAISANNASGFADDAETSALAAAASAITAAAEVGALAVSSGAALIGFTQSGTGAVAQTVDSKLKQSISAKDFGAVGDGVTDDTGAIQAAIDALPVGMTLDGLGRTYLVTSTINLKANTTLQNFVFDFSTASNSGELFNAIGSIATAVNVSAPLTAGQLTFTVADGSGFAKDDIVYIASSDYWDDWDDFVVMAETHYVKSVSGNNITLYEPILYGMSTSPTIHKVTPLKNLTLRNIRAIGSGAGASGDQEGGRFTYCENLFIDRCDFSGFDDRCLRLVLCVDFNISDGKFGRAYKTGLSYGVALQQACLNGKITGSTFYECRHGVSIGGTSGPSRYVIVSNNVFDKPFEAGMDAHTAVDFCTIIGNQFICTPISSLSDGILWRGGTVNISGNTVVDAGRTGICVLNNVTGATVSYNITGNSVYRSRAVGIEVKKQHAGNIKNLNIFGNVIQNASVANDYGISLTTINGYTNIVENVVVSNNTMSNFSYRAILVSVGSAASVLNNVVIANNTISSATFDRGVFVSATTDGNAQNITINGNVIAGTCAFGIRCTNEEQIVVTGNIIKTATTPVLLTATNSVNTNNLV